MVQVRQVFDKLSRVVRKISRDAGKEITFEVTGSDFSWRGLNVKAETWTEAFTVTKPSRF